MLTNRRAAQTSKISDPRGPGISKEKIWNTSSQEERERIKSVLARPRRG